MDHPIGAAIPGPLICARTIAILPLTVAIESAVRELVAAGDVRAAAAEVMRTLGPDVRRYLRSLLREDADAEEAFSSFAESLLRNLAGFRAESSLRTWVLRLAVNEAYDVRTTPWRRRVRRLMSAEASALADEVRGSTEPRLERRRLVVDRLRAQLPPEDQALLVMRIDRQLSWGDIAEVLAGSGEDVSPAALSKRFERIRRRLAASAKSRGLLD
ncbi:MAG: RNA polymerase sigma factor [Myxococcales bacterium]